MWQILLTAVLLVGVHCDKFECPKKEGFFPDSIQCDKYYECKDGKATEVLCADGLVFDPKLTRTGKCDQRYDVDCGDRTELQKPNRTSEYCPRKNGIFPHPDETICDVFYSCDDGIYSDTKCANGLHFQESTGQCTWPNVANREKCEDQTKKRKLKDGFECPKEPKTNAAGQIIVNPHYPHPESCENFYVCINGVEARELQCEPTWDTQERTVYNDAKKTCEIPANVPGCEDWFKEES